MIKVGDQVRVVDNGYVCSHYEEWVKEHALQDFVPPSDGLPENGAVGDVVAVGLHEFPGYGTVYGVRIDGRGFIITQQGVERVEPKPLPETEPELLERLARELDEAFTWADSAEGDSYWGGVFDALLGRAEALREQAKKSERARDSGGGAMDD